jgi:molybdate transport system substrate-binding protein
LIELILACAKSTYADAARDHRNAVRGVIFLETMVNLAPNLRAAHSIFVTWAATCALAAQATAADITVLAAGAGKDLMQRIEAPFSQRSGHRIKATFDTVGAQRERVEKGERPDLVMLSQAAIALLDKQGLIERDSIRDIGDVQVGVAIAATVSAPDISSKDALRATLLAAKSIAYADPARGATAGAHFAKVLRELGIADDVAKRVTVLPFGVEVIEAVAAGKYEIGISQSSEIVQHSGVRYVGALPAPYRLATRYQVAALKDRANAASLLEFLQTPAAQTAARQSGFTATE